MPTCLRTLRTASLTLAVSAFVAGSVHAQIKAPDYSECTLGYIHPLGGQQGTTLNIELGGLQSGLLNPRNVLIDGLPGIKVIGVKSLAGDRVQATLEIAADALPGRRMLRVFGERCGLTNFNYFVVGSLPEVVEKEPNGDPQTAERVTLPVVVNGKLDPELDVDCFRFRAHAGQNIVATVVAHGLDSRARFGKGSGFTDTSLEVRDEQGRVIADAEDTLGLDPMVELKVPADGWYTARVQQLSFKGSPESVYRLTLGEAPLVTSVFPPGGKRGETLDVELSGPNIPPRTRQRVIVGLDDFPLQWVTFDGGKSGGQDVPFVRGDHPELIEQEPNNDRQHATRLAVPNTVNARFDAAGDEDWYVLSLAKNQSVSLNVVAQQYLRSPVDTFLEVLDATGTSLAQNDDGYPYQGETPHEIDPFDSALKFTAKTAGEYFIRVHEQTGSFGPRAVYRLTVAENTGDFMLYQWPDAVPIWGPGSTAAFLVKVDRLGFLKGDIELRIEGLAPGWTGSVSQSLTDTAARANKNHTRHAFMTITAPADAPIGATTTFRVVGRMEDKGQMVEHKAQPLTFYHSGDRQFHRVSPVARAVVAQPQGPWLETTIHELTARQGEKVTIPVIVKSSQSVPEIPLVVNLATNGVACALGPPMTVKVVDGQANATLAIPADLPPGRHGITVARGWRSDFRGRHARSLHASHLA